jgi:hypothetical protein
VSVFDAEAFRHTRLVYRVTANLMLSSDHRYAFERRWESSVSAGVTPAIRT